jgi:microcystin-dependent protein
MRELVANMTLLRELVQAQADTIVFLEARVRILEETSAPTRVPSLAPTSVSTSDPTSVPITIPTMTPTAAPMTAPSPNPTESPTSAPTAAPADQIIPAGLVVWFASGSPPEGYLTCDGRSVSRTDYPALFEVIGTTFGGVNETTFRLPDLRGEFIRGIDGGRGVDIGREFGTSQSNSFQTHIHSTSALQTAVITHHHNSNPGTTASGVPASAPGVVTAGYPTAWYTLDWRRQRNETPQCGSAAVYQDVISLNNSSDEEFPSQLQS